MADLQRHEQEGQDEGGGQDDGPAVSGQEAQQQAHGSGLRIRN
jgi:hypothetical protein